MNWNLAIGARLGVGLKKGNGSDGVGIATMERVVMRGLEFAAVRTCVLVASGTLPSGRDEPVAFGIGTAMNEGRGVLKVVVMVVILLQELTFGNHKIIAKSGELLDLCGDVLDLCVNVLNEPVMGDGSLCGGKHGLFLCEQNVFLVSCEFAL